MNTNQLLNQLLEQIGSSTSAELAAFATMVYV